MKNYNNAVSTCDIVIRPGCESLLPLTIHPKEIRFIVFDGYNSNMTRGSDEFEKWFSSFNDRAVWGWIDDVMSSCMMQKKYRGNPSQYRKDMFTNSYGYNNANRRYMSGEIGCGCMKCRQADPLKMSHNKSRKHKNFDIRIKNEMDEMVHSKGVGRDEITRSF
jgi:hypothetical protein